MWSPRHALVTIFLCALAASLVFGCRAFEPESVVVNKPPETYIIGSPAETSGAYFHFRVFWYGTDEDGFVERYVWALTDTSIQDAESDDDEEDQNFNPATNATTLEIGTYTTRTDTVFDFQIGQGAGRTYDMTLHMVAMDDRGDFDRTPARLHFFSNALDNPELDFWRQQDDQLVEFADLDTIAFGDPLFLRWSGSTANAGAFYDQDLLAERDTVPPFDDGLLGFKWRLPEEDDCTGDDCWNPKAFDEATGDSFSYFGDVSGLTFLNDGSGSGPFGRVLDAGAIELLVNTIDVAGVEVPASEQLLRILVNYEPDTYILDDEQDPVDDHNDPLTYPRYHVFHGPQAGWYTFSEGDTVPDRSYVLFKALGWDDPRDQIESAQNRLRFQGRFQAWQFLRVDGARFPFETTFSDTHQTPEWTGADPTDWDSPSADTLGFQVGPFNYDVLMRAVDEQNTADGTPDTLSFVGNFPPCVQCIELGRLDMDAAGEYDDIEADNCQDAGCLENTRMLKIFTGGIQDPRYDPTDATHLSSRSAGGPASIWINPLVGAITLDEPTSGDWITLPAAYFHMLVYLHGKDHPQEYWPPNQAHQRIKAWRYEINYEGDPNNVLLDGGGRDNISLLTGFNVSENNPDPNSSDLFIEPDSGVWGVVVKVAVPLILDLGGPEGYWSFLLGAGGLNCDPPAGTTPADTLAWQQTSCVQQAYRAWQLTLAQFTPGTVSAIAVDQSLCDYRFRTNTYHFYDGTRVPTPNGRRCEDRAYDQPPDQLDPTGILERGALDLEEFAAFSNDRIPVVKDFHIEIYRRDAFGNPIDEPIVGGVDPPGWISTAKDRRVTWR